jgi:hypothetical protein
MEEFISMIFKSPGPGGAIVLIVISLAAITYYFLTRWILFGGEQDEHNTHRRFR